ncbi:MAG: hypothetical protein AABX83_02955 [Nanoarchaeota archaeon]
MTSLNRAQLILELEYHFNKKVFAIIYNPAYEEGIKEGDHRYFYDFIHNIIKDNNLPLDSIWIISGMGGNLKSAIACSDILRKSLKRYETFIPSIVGSALCYFVLQSDKLLIGERSIITQMDPMFEYEGEELRAIKRLNDPDPSRSTLAKSLYNPVFENLKELIKNQPHVFEDEVSKISKNKTNYLIKLVDFWLGKDFHESGLTMKEMKEMKIKLKIINEEIIEKARLLVKECINELMEEDQRFVIQTGNIEGEYLGGYFYP